MTSKRWNMTLEKLKNFLFKHRKSVLLGFIVDSSQFLLWKQSQMRIFRILLRFPSVKLCLLSVETFFGNFTYLFVCQNQNLIKYFAKTNPKNFQFPIYFLEKSWNFAKYVKNMTKIQNMTFGSKYDKSYDLHILIKLRSLKMTLQYYIYCLSVNRKSCRLVTTFVGMPFWRE